MLQVLLLPFLRSLTFVSSHPTQIHPSTMASMMSSPLLLVLVAMVLQMASADFDLASSPGTIRSQDRDPFKEGYFNMITSCFALMFFFIACMFSVRICLGKRRGNDSQSFFLVA